MDHSTLLRIVENVEQVIVDKRYEIELTLVALICRGHLLIEDVPGVGKTSLASAIARSLGCSFKRIQFTPDIMPADITGFTVFNPKTGDFEYRPGAILSQIVLADEINRTSPKTQSSLLEAMEEKQVTVDGATYKLKEPFIVLATQNPVEHMGTYPLPEAQLDRFFMRISLGYPNRGEEVRMTLRFRQNNPLKTLGPVASEQDILALQHMADQIYVDDLVAGYIVDLVRHTRENAYAALGASPRASINLYKAAQAWAL
jgi:MoxR-like ATPase